MFFLVFHRDGRLQENDQILAINEQVLDASISHQQAIRILQQAKGMLIDLYYMWCVRDRKWWVSDWNRCVSDRKWCVSDRKWYASDRN